MPNKASIIAAIRMMVIAASLFRLSGSLAIDPHGHAATGGRSVAVDESRHANAERPGSLRLTITSNLPNDEHSIPRLEDHVERRFRGATDLSKAACSDYLGKFHLSGLRAQRHAHLLR